MSAESGSTSPVGADVGTEPSPSATVRVPAGLDLGAALADHTQSEPVIAASSAIIKDVDVTTDGSVSPIVDDSTPAGDLSADNTSTSSSSSSSSSSEQPTKDESVISVAAPDIASSESHLGVSISHAVVQEGHQDIAVVGSVAGVTDTQTPTTVAEAVEQHNQAQIDRGGGTAAGDGMVEGGGQAIQGQAVPSQEQSTRRRVKLYLLNAERQWDDKGTGYVSSPYIESLGGTSLVVRAEVDGSLLLESRVQQDTAYQRQQGTLIVWSEGDNYDLALSFQERAGCDEIWRTICQIQGRDPSVEITQEVVESEDESHDQVSINSSNRALLPACELSNLAEICKLLQDCLPYPLRRDGVAGAIEADDYVSKLLEIFHVAEDLEDMESLHHLYNIFKSIFLLNKNALLDIMFTEENIMTVVGVLEYDPNKTRTKHREYLNAQARFHQVIPFTDPELTAKIHQTYRVQYIQEVVLPTPSIFEENMLSCLSSFVFFNKADIVGMLQEDRQFLDQLFTQLKQETSIEHKRDLVLFLKEFCNFSQTLQPQCREPFFKTLFSLGILQVIEVTLTSDDATIKSASIDILSYLVDFSTAMVREYCLEQYQNGQERLLMEIILRQILADPEPDVGVSVQLSGILRMLLDPETFMPNENKNSFFNFFYKYSMHILTERIFEHQKQAPTSPRAALLAHIIEFLSFCVEHHAYHIKNYILHKDLLRKVLEFMKYRHPHLALCALRFVRRIVGLKDDFYNRHITVNCLFRPIVDALKRNSGRYNLLDSAIIELFEFIRSEDIKSLGSHAVENYSKDLETITYVQTFKALRAKFEDGALETQMKVPTVTDCNMIGPNTELKFRRDPRQLDEDEEKWFDADEDTMSATQTTIADGLEDDKPIQSLALAEAAAMRQAAGMEVGSIKLVDYPDEDSDDEQNNSSLANHTIVDDVKESDDPPAKRIRLEEHVDVEKEIVSVAKDEDRENEGEAIELEGSLRNNTRMSEDMEQLAPMVTDVKEKLLEASIPDAGELVAASATICGDAPAPITSASDCIDQSSLKSDVCSAATAEPSN